MKSSPPLNDETQKRLSSKRMFMPPLYPSVFHGDGIFTLAPVGAIVRHGKNHPTVHRGVAAVAPVPFALCTVVVGVAKSVADGLLMLIQTQLTLVIFPERLC